MCKERMDKWNKNLEKAKKTSQKIANVCFLLGFIGLALLLLITYC